MNRITLVLVLSLLGVSCGSLDGLQESINRIPETKIQVTESILVTKNGMHIGNVDIKPTIFRPVVNEIRYPKAFGLTITYKF